MTIPHACRDVHLHACWIQPYIRVDVLWGWVSSCVQPTVDSDLAGGKKRSVSKDDALLARRPLRSRSRCGIVQSDGKQEARANVWHRNIRFVSVAWWQRTETFRRARTRFPTFSSASSSGSLRLEDVCLKDFNKACFQFCLLQLAY